jgi:hypothetical protein
VIDPALALVELASELRAEDSVVSPHVVEPNVSPALGAFVAAGPRARAAPGDYAVIVESIREGYLLHYGKPRIVAGADRDLRLLSGDYLYALGLERLSALGDSQAVGELSDLISLAAEVHDGTRDDARRGRESGTLWLAATVAIAAGPSAGHATAKAALQAGLPDAGDRLWTAARAIAAGGGLDDELMRTADAIDWGSDPPS